MSKDIVTFEDEGLRLDTAEDAEKICIQLAGRNIKILNLQGNTIGTEAAERIGFELSNQPHLREAHFKDMFTSRGRDEAPEAMKHLLSGISESGATLELLDLSDNAIGPVGAPSLIEFLETPSAQTIEKLYLNNCGLGPEGSSSIAKCIPHLKRLKEFVCGRNRLEDKGATSMSRALAQLNTLEVIKMPQNGIFVEGIRQLVDAFKNNMDTLKEIDLSDNTIKAEGADALEEAILLAKKLEILRLDDCLLENEGFSIICDALSKSLAFRNMKMAAFEGNEIHGSNIVDLIHITFSNCGKDFTLNLLANEFTEAELMRLEELNEQFNILVDDPVSDDDEDEEDDDDNHSD